MTQIELLNVELLTTVRDISQMVQMGHQLQVTILIIHNAISGNLVLDSMVMTRAHTCASTPNIATNMANFQLIQAIQESSNAEENKHNLNIHKLTSP